MTRLDDMLERYGEAATCTKAAHIIGRSAQTVKHLSLIHISLSGCA